MAGDFAIRPGSIRTGARDMRRCAEDLAGAVETLQAQVLGAGTPWGADPLGSVFGEAYAECTRGGLSALGHLVQVVGSVAAALGTEADNVQATDERVATDFDRTY